LTPSQTCSKDLILDWDDRASAETIALDLFFIDFGPDIEAPGNTPPDFFYKDMGKKEIEVDFPSSDLSVSTQVSRHPLFSAAVLKSSRKEFEKDLLSADIDPDVENAGKPHARLFEFRTARPSGIFISALIHGSIFFLFALFSATQVAGTQGYAGNIFSATIVSQEDLIPQNESPASIDSAASAPSRAKKSKKAKEIQQPREQPADVHYTGTEATRISMLEKRKPLEKQDEIKDPVKEVTDKNEDAQAEGLQNSVASLPSTASAERRFIPAAGQGGEVFESMVLSAIRASIFYPKQAAQERRHGEVAVAFAINKDGSVSSLSVAKSSGFTVLDEAALKIIQKAAKKFPPFPDRLSMDALHYVVPILFKEKVK
jgi:protein TonB